ncbi:DUF317 domain-containing protein [Streptomyces sp. NPDC004111]|uniref:DUF317 domain-containing protein n=1 Tax=Streptomyces sp. NPDC004111 TaxID=3364690 RepID=UPI00369F33B7
MTRQWQGWGPAEQAEQHYLVQPRSLGGGGDVQHVAAYLRAAGWTDKSKRGGPLVLVSPDRTLRLGYDPYTQPGGWTVHGQATARQAAWTATFGRQTPVEIIAGLTDALDRPRTAHAPNVWAPLQEQHWRPVPGAKHPTAASPDNTAWLQFRQDPDGHAIWCASAGDQHGTGWKATFTPSTPMHLVEAFSTALASPDPVLRPRGHVPASPQIRTTSVSVRPSQLSAWQQARTAAARATLWARNWRPGKPGTTAATRLTTSYARTSRR